MKAGGSGLNLTSANHVFHFDRWWNPAVENRATDRAYRIGQTRNVQVHKFVCAGTLEEKIDEMIGVLKAKGVPVLWVGLPAVRGAKATADVLFLNSLYRDAAGKAGITYVDVWDGFVDEAGRFLQQGPDFEGQIRRLRSYDGVYFTRPGARKLAHYAEREITRLLAGRSAPACCRSRASRQAAPGRRA